VIIGRNRRGDGTGSGSRDQAGDAFESHLTPAMPTLAASPRGYQACPRRGVDYCARFARPERPLQGAAGRSCTAVRAGPLIWVQRSLGPALSGAGALWVRRSLGPALSGSGAAGLAGLSGRPREPLQSAGVRRCGQSPAAGSRSRCARAVALLV
jgi:hypothetical protein